MANFSLNVSKLPTHDQLATGHWPVEQQWQFTQAVQGVQATLWFQVGCAQLPKAERERVAMAFVHAAMSATLNRDPE